MKNLLVVLLMFISIISSGQEKPLGLQKVFRLNFINPGIEYEFPISNRAVIAANPGIGLNTSFTSSRWPFDDRGLTYFISPFFDIAYKNIYNRDARKRKSRNLDYNSGNYWGVRFLAKFEEFNIGITDREDNLDFALSPTWGIQRAFGKFHLLFEFTPSYFFDTKGNHYFFPLIIHLNFGFNAKKW